GSTPTRLVTALVTLVVAGTSYGLTGYGGASDAHSDVAMMRSGGRPFTVDAQTLYTKLSDADASASAEFVATGAQQGALRTQHDAEMPAAAASLTKAIAESPPMSPDIEPLVADLSRYQGMVMAARLRNPTVHTAEATSPAAASRWMRNTLLPAAQDVY